MFENKILLKIIYFSGTGNAKNVAHWIASVANKNEINNTLIDISVANDRKYPKNKANELIGIVSPTHGFNYPPIMLHYIFRFPKAKNNKVFLINTRAGMKIGKLFLPGLSGIALLLSALVLFIKGYKIVGMQSIDLPSNWISLHPGLKKQVVESIYVKRKAQTLKFADKVLSGKKSYRALYNIVQDILVSPIALAYYLIGRFLLAKSFIASSDCSKCGLCINNCAVNAIRWVDKRPFWSYKCESCMQCMNACPEKAIETAHGYFIGIIILVKSVILIWLYNRFALNEILLKYLPQAIGGIAVMLINSIVYIVIFVLSYYLLHYLMRFKIIGSLIKNTSLTHFRFWRRYKI